MVFFEELEDDEPLTMPPSLAVKAAAEVLPEPAPEPASASTAAAAAEAEAEASARPAASAAEAAKEQQVAARAASGEAAAARREPALKPGFLERAKEPLYPPEGSKEGQVAPETHKAHAEHKLNKDLNEGMNRGAKENNGLERPPWYTKEWPKDCQYNSPGCTLHDLDTSAHPTELHREMVRGNSRWQEALAPGVKSMRLSFAQLVDEDLKEVIERLKGDEDLTELDLSHNHIKDGGIQALVAALAAGAAKNLRDLRIYNNDFGDLGRTMLTQGLPVFRKKLEVHWKEPSWAALTKPKDAPATAPAAA